MRTVLESVLQFQAPPCCHMLQSSLAHTRLFSHLFPIIKSIYFPKGVIKASGICEQIQKKVKERNAEALGYIDMN